MKKAALIIISMIIGAGIFEIGQRGYYKYAVWRDMKIFDNSTDQDEVIEVVRKFMFSSSTGETLVRSVFGYDPDGRPVSTRMICLDAIEAKLENQNFFWSLFEGSLNSNRNVKLRSLEIIDNSLADIHLLGIQPLFRTLPNENDKEILLMKIGVVSKYLFLDNEEMVNKYDQEGLESLIKFLKERQKNQGIVFGN
ncbi:MAG: hypothetical protein KAS23_12020, partial [Anaerohalosphaera sp.]|nr:hypothetical protein [Anaerohalosphaera sp.]